MWRQELDWDGDAFVMTLYFPDPEVTLSGCSNSGCDDETASWEEQFSSTDPGMGVNTQFGMLFQVSRSACCSNW